MSAGIGEGFPVRATDPVLHTQPAYMIVQTPKSGASYGFRPNNFLQQSSAYPQGSWPSTPVLKVLTS